MHISITIPRVGSIYYIPELNRRNGFEKDNRDVSWEILSTVTYQDNDGELRTICTMLALDVNGEELALDPEKVNLDLFDHIDV
jgi:hypothetical protein